MRKIKDLTEDELEQLRRIVRTTSNKVLKKRCQCIMYSFHGMKVQDLMDVFDVNRRTVYNWLNRWEEDGVKGLQDKPGRGLKPKLNPQNALHVEQVRKALQTHPRQPGQALQIINSELKTPVSRDTLRRFVKKISHTGINTR